MTPNNADYKLRQWAIWSKEDEADSLGAKPARWQKDYIAGYRDQPVIPPGPDSEMEAIDRAVSRLAMREYCHAKVIKDIYLCFEDGGKHAGHGFEEVKFAIRRLCCVYDEIAPCF